jgi:hypothetical protein
MVNQYLNNSNTKRLKNNLNSIFRILAYSLILPNTVRLIKYEVQGTSGINYYDLHAKKWKIIEKLYENGYIAGFYFDNSIMYLLTLHDNTLPKTIQQSFGLKNQKRTLRIITLGEGEFKISEPKIADGLGVLIRGAIVAKLKSNKTSHTRYGSDFNLLKEILFKDIYQYKDSQYEVMANLKFSLNVRVISTKQESQAIISIVPKISQVYKRQGTSNYRPLKQSFTSKLVKHKSGADNSLSKKNLNTAAKDLRRISKPEPSELIRRATIVRQVIGDFSLFGNNLVYDLIEIPKLFDIDNTLSTEEMSRKAIREQFKQFEFQENPTNKKIKMLVVRDEGLNSNSFDRIPAIVKKYVEAAHSVGFTIDITEIVQFRFTKDGKLLNKENLVTELELLLDKYRYNVDVVTYFLHGAGDISEGSKGYNIWNVITVASKALPSQRIFSLALMYAEKDPYCILPSIIYKALGIGSSINKLQKSFDYSVGWDLSVTGSPGDQRSLIAAGAVTDLNNRVFYHYNNVALLPKRSEKVAPNLTFDLLKDLLIQNIPKGTVIENGLLFVRDGISYEDLFAIDQLVSYLMDDNSHLKLKADADIFLVELTKTQIIRGVVGSNGIPKPGDAVKLSTSEVILWTTNPEYGGHPQGILIRVKFPSIIDERKLKKVISKIFADTCLRYSSGTKARLPVQITVAEDTMRYVKAFLDLKGRLPLQSELPAYIMS